MPTLTPAPGSTPDAVVASGSWDVPTQMAKLNCTASTDPNLLGYEWRVCSGPVFSTDNEAVVPGGFIPAGGNREISTLAGLPTGNSTASFRAYVITTTGNEKGSNTVSIFRPSEVPPPPPSPPPPPP